VDGSVALDERHFKYAVTRRQDADVWHVHSPWAIVGPSAKTVS